MRSSKTLPALTALMMFTTAPAMAQDGVLTLITNVNVFDGENETLIENAYVVITNNLITAVST